MDDVAAPYASSAYWIAAVRARETARPDRLFADPLAAAMAGELGLAVLDRSERASGGENPYLPVRTRFVDDVLGSAAQVVQQVVMLGAGLDTRPFRLPGTRGLRWFEIDRPELFERKELVLARAAARPYCVRVLVFADLGEDWPERLLALGFDPDLPTAWVAEGLFFYLAAGTVDSVLSRTRHLSSAGSLLVADAFDSGIMASAGMPAFLEAAGRRGLPPPFWTDEPATLFGQHGWEHVDIVEPGDPGANFGRLPADGGRPAHLSATRSWFIVGRAGDPREIR